MAITMSAEMKHPMTLAMKVCCHVMPVAIKEAAAFHPVVPNAPVNQNMASPYLEAVSLDRVAGKEEMLGLPLPCPFFDWSWLEVAVRPSPMADSDLTCRSLGNFDRVKECLFGGEGVGNASPRRENHNASD